jgi:RNA polymerase subunit RPABC4/transcription elongation factor Spt4
MALRPCKECKKEISSDAKVCPHCGKKVARISAGTWLAMVILLLAALGYLARMGDQPNVGGPGPGASADRNAGAIAPIWEYSSQHDKMGRGPTYFASLQSVNEVDFDFPYNGGSKGILTLRNSPRYGRDAVLQVTKGQFLCSLDGCQVNVRVDGGRPIRVTANEAADGSSNVVFLPYGVLLRAVRGGRVLLIEANFYREGSRVFEFHAQGLDAKRLETPKAPAKK